MLHRARPCAICNLNLNLLLTTASICEPFPQLASFPLRSRSKYGCSFEKQSRAVAVYILCFCPSLIFFPHHATATPQNDFVALKLAETIDGFQVEDSN